MRRHEAAAVVATLKDLVKIEQPKIGDIPFQAVNIRMDVMAGNDLLESRLARLATESQTGRGA